MDSLQSWLSIYVNEQYLLSRRFTSTNIRTMINSVFVGAFVFAAIYSGAVVSQEIRPTSISLSIYFDKNTKRYFDFDAVQTPGSDNYTSHLVVSVDDGKHPQREVVNSYDSLSKVQYEQMLRELDETFQIQTSKELIWKGNETYSLWLSGRHIEFSNAFEKN